MIANIRFVPLPDVDLASSRVVGTSAAEVEPSADVTLRFGLEASGPQVLDAIRQARRSMLREELTRGDADEPLLQDALFSPGEIVWNVRPEQRDWCLQKVEELEARVRRWLSEGERALAT
jgi:hypothetical protein